MTCSGSLATVATVVLFGLAGCARPVAAQDNERRFAIGAAAGLALPLHGDFDFNAAAWQADVRYDVARYFAVGIFFEEWRHSTEEVRTNLRVVGPAGPLGTIARLTQRTEHVTRAVGWNAVAKTAPGAFVVYGGGGVSYLSYDRTFTQTVEGCQYTVPRECSGFSNEFSNGAFSAQAEAGVEVAIAWRMSATGQFRVLVPMSDPGSGHTSVFGGVRLRL